MTKITRLNIPALPFGFNPTYFDSRKFNLSGLNKGFNFTPRLAVNPQNFIDRGCTTVNINAGYASGPGNTPGAYTAVARQNRSVFLGSSYIRDSSNGKHFSDYTLDDCRRSANYAWNRADGYGVITSGAQETDGALNPDWWGQLTTYSVSAYKGMSQAWGEVMAANPGTLYFGCYDGLLYFNVNDGAATVRQALSSPANALQYLLNNSYGPNPYFQLELWRYHPPLLNLYFRAKTDLSAKLYECRVAIQLVKLALQAVGATWPVMAFYFPGRTEFVDYSGNGYSEYYYRDTPGGGTMMDITFPDYSHAFQMDQTFMALNNADHYYGWEDTLIYGADPSIVPPDIIRDDGYRIRHHEGGSVTVQPMGPTPYDASHVYPFFPNYDGNADLAPLAAEMYEYVARYAGQNSQVARHRKAGSSNWCSLDSGYLVDRFFNREPVVDVARNGNIGWVKTYDYVSEMEDPYDLQVDVGNNQTVTIPVDPHAFNLHLFDLNAN